MIFDNLRPCPFCGSNRVAVGCSDTDTLTQGVHFDTPFAVAICFSCCAAAGFVKIGGRHTREEAIEGAKKFWNQRADDEEDYDDL